jgi:hypothetical protein
MAETPQERALAAGLEQHRSPGTAMVTGLFRDRASAERAWQAAAHRGYGSEDINLVMSEDTRRRHFAAGDAVETELGSKAAEGAGIGAGIGGALGAIAAALAALGTSIALPGLGLVIAGPLAAGLAGAGAGGITGGLLGALVGAGIPEERVKHYEEGLREGGILMGVTPRSADDARELERSWREHEGEHVLGTGVGATGGAVSGAVIGSPAGPLGMAAGAAIGAVAGGLGGKAASEVAHPEERAQTAERTIATGVGTGMGALVGATLGGPPGMAAGAAIGGIVAAGAALGKDKEGNEATEDIERGGDVHLAQQESHWRSAYASEPYHLADYGFEDYAPAYHLGYTHRRRLGGSFEEAEARLVSEWEYARGASRLSWEQARPAVRAAWERIGE